MPPKAVLLTFDDGYKNNFTDAYPILKKFGHKATIFVPTDFICGGILPHDLNLSTRQPVLGWEELSAMNDVFEVGSHGCSHRIMTRLPRLELERELRVSKEILENGLGSKVRAFAYPKGSIKDFNGETEMAVREAGYEFCFTTIPGTNLAGMNPLRLKRYGVEDFGMLYFRRLLDGSADVVGLKDTHFGYSVKALVNQGLGLD
ncbi:MAG: polysaccharide deacetylase family protein [Candidatus Binataceae bacterium]